VEAEASSQRQRWRDRAASLEAAAVSGVLFAVLFVASISLMRAGLPDLGMTRQQIAEQYLDGNAQQLVLLGFSLAPFAAIAFLWFVAVLRRRMPPQDQFVSTVFVTAGAVFIALFLVAAALVGGPYYLLRDAAGADLDPQTLIALESVAYGLVFVVGVRVQVLIVLSATAAARAHHALPRWLILCGYAVALLQTVNLALFEPLVFTFPAWVAAVSLTLLRGRTQSAAPVPSTGGP